jgi:hypothetical protein
MSVNKGLDRVQAEAMFAAGGNANQAAKKFGVSYATARVWWLTWKVARYEAVLDANCPDCGQPMLGCPKCGRTRNAGG